ncbi:hypothetical protein FDA94_10670 [Herbidospora galbida]|uniref:Uncharacterized protein n=1 Tax=Herbidospora galbida TaxID=2575442 RepID=A0A4U3MHN2_9ACTN|nr:hypothetical protein [Herbidospora galbida]TKK88978.1 hypothetical protein FDA94_10670 [Herbidospora galbida]
MDLDTKNRAGLVDGKLIESEKRERGTIWYLVTPAGEERALEEVQKGVAVTSRSGKTLALLYLRTLLGPAVPAAEEVAPEPEAAPEPAAVPVALGGDEVEDRIREAYAKITPGVGEWVTLTRLRPLLDDIDRSEQDNALRRMLLNSPEVHILAASIPGNLSPEDHAAAVVIGSEPNHQLRIGAR